MRKPDLGEIWKPTQGRTEGKLRLDLHFSFSPNVKHQRSLSVSHGTFLVAQMVKNLNEMWETWV